MSFSPPTPTKKTFSSRPSRWRAQKSDTVAIEVHLPRTPFPYTDSMDSTASTASSSSCATPAAAPPPEKSRRSRAVEIVVSGVSAILLVPLPYLKREAPTEWSETTAHFNMGGCLLSECPPRRAHVQNACQPRAPSLTRTLTRNGASTSEKPTRLQRMLNLPRSRSLTGPRPSTPPRHRACNSLILPEVLMPDEPDELPPPRASHRATLANPPPREERLVRFITPPPGPTSRKLKRSSAIRNRLPDPPSADMRADDEEPAWSEFMRNDVERRS
ncbi:hypothetical protein B0H17DRAFT_1130073 [Mycena rosella]|uniref:Uncharacterized protein n=1 Tax=Mycena rosella TaxID=1033263 RepID=A0AAD7DR36_MYCRO|nr:hypothetical protein B0H17DRAFT_1130073 [Mycena rosella]